MTVYTRGYRPYAGDFSGAPAIWVIMREGIRAAWARRGVRMLSIFFLLWFVIGAVALYMQINLTDLSGRASPLQELIFQDHSRTALCGTYAFFYGGIAVIGALAAVMVGTGLISDDLRHKALSLYLVRPIRPIDYAIGKALTIPVVFLGLSILPGIVYYLLVMAWQEPGESAEFFHGNTDLLWLLLKHYVIAATSYTGLMLIASSRTARRGAVVGLTAVILFGGTMLGLVGATLRGPAGTAFRHMGLPENAAAPMLIANLEQKIDSPRHVFSPPERHLRRAIEAMPDTHTSLIIGCLLFAIGLLLAYRRARTAEVVS